MASEGRVMKRVKPRISKVVHLDPEDATFRAMLSGWDANQIARGNCASTRKRNIRTVTRFQEFLNEYPWHWRPVDIEDFTAHLMSRRDTQLSPSTVRGYHYAIRTFCEYLSNPHYEWASECEHQFGSIPVQICFDWNTVRHVAQFEGRPTRRPFNYDELQTFFDTADAQIDAARQKGVKGSLEAYRDSQIFKTIYAFGLRRTEARMLDVHDIRHNIEVPEWGGYGSLHVRFGKATKGSQPRRRTILALPEFEWAVEGLRHWVEHVRPLYKGNQSAALWPTERNSRISARALNDRFRGIRESAGLDPALTLHSLRHSYVTHLIEHGYAEHFVQVQVGHAYSATTAIYTSVSDDFKNRTLARAIERVKGNTHRGQP